MRIKYDRESDVLDILLKDAQIHHAKDYGQIIVNYDKDGEIVEIEILDASKILSEILQNVLKSSKENVIEIRI